MALHSSLVMFCLGVFAFFNMVLILPLSSSATPCSSFWHTFSTSVMQSTMGGSLSTIAKFGPWAKSLSCTVDKGLLEMLMTHLALDLVVVVVLLASSAVDGVSLVFSTVSPAVSCSFDACLPMPPYCWFEWPPLFFWHNQLNLFICLNWVLMCLDSFLVLMKTIHSSIDSSSMVL